MATLRDVAREAGLNVSTVSRVLNNRGYISEEARARVDSAMKKLHYRPNEIARSLRTQNSGLIGVIVPSVSNSYFSELVAGLMKNFDRAGYHTLLFDTDDNCYKFREYLHVCESYHVDAVVLMSNQIKMEDRESLTFPIISVERDRGWADACVRCDNIGGGRKAAQHLIDIGCRRIVNLSWTPTPFLKDDLRAQGFAETARKNHVECRIISVTDGGNDSRTTREATEQALVKNRKADGIFTSSDIIASYVIKSASKLGISIPDDLCLVGFDDVPMAEMLTPSLTTIRQDIPAMTSEVVKLLSGLIAGEKSDKDIIVPVKLIIRGTTAVKR